MNIIKLFKGISLLVFVTTLSCNKTTKEGIWTLLQDGDTLNGWTIKDGTAEFTVKDGVISSKTKLENKSTFLATEKAYGDFILELDCKLEKGGINSGIQIRSQALPYYKKGVVVGYQVEIDPSERFWSGGINDYRRRQWLLDLEDNPEGMKAFRPNEWNHFRIEAIGDTIKTWVNGIATAHLIDDRDASGFIALENHRVIRKSSEGKEIAWKNIKIITENLEKYSTKSPLVPVNTKNKLTKAEFNSDWKMLWDGTSTDAWRSALTEDFPSDSWDISNGELSIKTNGTPTDIMTKAIYRDFEMKIDFKLEEGANSGIKYYVNPVITEGKASMVGLEYQILDDKNNSEAKVNTRTLGSLYDLIEAKKDKPLKPAGQWNQVFIRSVENNVQHWLNGMLVLDYKLGEDDFLELVSQSKYKAIANFGTTKEGRILLQNHGQFVSFKNMKIRDVVKRNLDSY